jgi:hypothetical protein
MVNNLVQDSNKKGAFKMKSDFSRLSRFFAPPLRIA